MDHPVRNHHFVGRIAFPESVTYIESYAAGFAAAENGTMTITFAEPADAAVIDPGKEVQSGSLKSIIDYLGKSSDASVFACADTFMKDGIYEVMVVCGKVRLLWLLLK